MTSDPTNPPILVIGATGRHGNTGEYLVGAVAGGGPRCPGPGTHSQ